MNWNELAMLFLNENLVTTAETCFEVNGFCFYPGRKFCVSERCIHAKTQEGIIQWIGSPPELSPSNDNVTLEILQTEVRIQSLFAGGRVLIRLLIFSHSSCPLKSVGSTR
jgi:hypothetical protein